MSIKTANLLELAEILETADEKHLARGEPTYEQDFASHDCGTPACALGHWVAAKHPVEYKIQRWSWGQIMQQDFGLDDEYADIIFGSDGCGRAQTAKDAAAFIRTFVEAIEE